MSSVPAGLVIIPAAALCIGYLLPYASRRRAQSWEVPLEDRFSLSARAIEPTAEPSSPGPSSVPLLARTEAKRTEVMQRPATSRPAKPVRPITPARPSGAGAPKPTKRPGQTGAKAAAAAKTVRPAKPDRSASAGPPAAPANVDHRFVRARAAAIRASLTGAFALLMVMALTLNLTSGLTIWAAVCCGALTGGMLVLGRRAAVAERSAAGRASRVAVSAPVPDAAQPATASTARPISRPGHGRSAGAGKTAVAARGAASADRAEAGGKAANKRRAGAATERSGEKAVGGGTTASTREAEARAARRPGVSGRVKSGRTVYHLPEPVKITPLEAAESAEDTVKPRRVTPARPTPAPAKAQLPRETKPKKALTPTAVPAPTYTLMPDAPKW
ncbi:MAG: hypothetical protein LBG11_04445, partial [Bifidobacteriaceae bacterium]|nr:hypothetical protein [Bifidobacteriaceae bacterium]